jgi:hypothetical protein
MKNFISNLSPKIEPIRGSVVTSFVKCSRSNCKCLQGQLHGPYFYRFWRQNGKRVKQYIRKQDLLMIKAACDSYKHQKQLNKQIHQENLALWRKLKAQLKELISDE